MKNSRTAVGAWYLLSLTLSLLLTGRTVHSSEALDALKRRAEGGDAPAQLALGRMYDKGKGVPADRTEATRWYRRAADGGNSSAQFTVGGMYYLGMEVSQPDPSEAFKWFRKAADQDMPEAAFAVGLCYLKGEGVPRDEVAAVKWMGIAAARQHSGAEYYLGWMNETGAGVAKDVSAAATWYHKSAEQGHAIAQKSLADLQIRITTSGSQGLEDALKWYRKAAENGLVEAQLALTSIYWNGTRVPVNKIEAIKWCRMAAKNGDGTAQFLLGYSYADGDGVPKDPVESTSWLQLASDQGHAEAKKLLTSIAFTSYAGIGSGRLSITSTPPNTAFYAFSGQKLLFSGMTPFQRTDLPDASALEMCFSRVGYENQWKTVYVPRDGLVVSGISLRPLADPQARSRDCLAEYQSAAEDAVREKQKQEQKLRELKSRDLLHDLDKMGVSSAQASSIASGSSTPVQGGWIETQTGRFSPDSAPIPAVRSSPTTYLGAIDVRTGQLFPNIGNGNLVNPSNGTFYQKVGGGYINSRTGQFSPGW